MEARAHWFLEKAFSLGALKLGEFRTRAGRTSPYFFNITAFFQGRDFAELSDALAEMIRDAGVGFDGVFGPAYKGLFMASAVAMAFGEKNIPFCSLRKEEKTRGERGLWLGVPPSGRVLLVDDVLSAGTSFGKAVAAISACGARPVVLAVALDREEKNLEGKLARDALESSGVRVLSLARLSDVKTYLLEKGETKMLDAITAYERLWGDDGAKSR